MRRSISMSDLKFDLDFDLYDQKVTLKALYEFSTQKPNQTCYRGHPMLFRIRRRTSIIWKGQFWWVTFRLTLITKKQNLSGLGKSSFSNFFIRRDSSDPSKALDSLGKKSGQKKKIEIGWILSALGPNLTWSSYCVLTMYCRYTKIK